MRIEGSDTGQVSRLKRYYSSSLATARGRRPGVRECPQWVENRRKTEEIPSRNLDNHVSL
jgi:hypothetical protein